MGRMFTKLDEQFVCLVCKKKVDKLGYTSRDHCPYCLHSIHVDINPGDRACECKGILKPIGLEKKRETYRIVYRCQKCGVRRINIVANDDNKDLIIKLSSQVI